MDNRHDQLGTAFAALRNEGRRSPIDHRVAARGRVPPDGAHVRAAGPLITHPSPRLFVDDEIYTFLPMSTSDEVRSSAATLVAMGSSAIKVWYLRPPAAEQEVLDARLMEVGAVGAGGGSRPDRVRDGSSGSQARAARRGQDGRERGYLCADVDRIRELGPRGRFGDSRRAPNPSTTRTAAWTPTPWRRSNGSARISPNVSARKRLGDSGSSGREAGNAVLAENLRRVYAAGATVVVATDAGNPFTLHGRSIP